MRIAGLQKCSTLDFPGALCAVIFSAGCNYRCFYCHNRHILEAPPLLAEEEVLAFLQKRAGLLDGVVFSGGEPTLDPDLTRWVGLAKALGYQVKLDTNGSRPAVVAALLESGQLDYVAMDYKAPLSRYPALCAAEASGVAETLSLLRGAGVPFELRTTVVPQLDGPALESMAREIGPLARWALQLYRPQPGDERFLGGKIPYRPDQLETLADTLRELAPAVFVRA